MVGLEALFVEGYGDEKSSVGFWPSLCFGFALFGQSFRSFLLDVWTKARAFLDFGGGVV